MKRSVCVVDKYKMISIESGVEPRGKQEALAWRLCLWNAMTDQWDSQSLSTSLSGRVGLVGVN